MSDTRIFVSYRHEDSRHAPDRIRDKLWESGYTHVFMDTEIPRSDPWDETVVSELHQAEVVVAVIGRDWLTCRDDSGRRRIDGEADWVRRELREALAGEKRVLPVLVDGARMPEPAELPSDLERLAFCAAEKVRRRSFDDDVNRLVRAIDGKSLPATLILTSTSPRRRALLESIGWRGGRDYFAVGASVSPPGVPSSLTVAGARHVAESTAVRKVEAIRKQRVGIHPPVPVDFVPSHTIVVGVDTLVYCEGPRPGRGQILDRPLLVSRDTAGPFELAEARRRARAMLVDERGRTIQVITSLAAGIMNSGDRPTIRTVVTEARLREYSDREIDDYLATADPIDKAGAFGIQDAGVSLFRDIRGSYSNVVGLPLAEFVELLEGEFGDTFTIPERRPPVRTEGGTAADRIPSVVCVGDINFDLIFDDLPEGFFADLKAPGKKITIPITRAVGGTAVNFAKGALSAGFALPFSLTRPAPGHQGQAVSREKSRQV